MRSGFTLIELILSMAIIAVLFASLVPMINSAKEDEGQRKEFAFYESMEDGIKQSFISILDAYEPAAGTVTSDATTTWGWGRIRSTSPFPWWLGSKKIRYSLDSRGISSTQRNRLIQTIIGSFHGVCTQSSLSGNNLDLMCPKLSNLNYTFGGGAVARAHTLGTDLNPSSVPTVRLGFKRRSPTGFTPEASWVNQTHTFTMADVYSLRQNYSFKKISEIRRSLRRWFVSKLSLELKNGAPGGLNSIDDTIIPWEWMLTGGNGSAAHRATIFGSGSKCIHSGSVCSNINSGGIGLWPSGSIKYGRVARRISSYMFHGDKKYNVDGFNNQLMIHPLSNTCGTNLTTCSVTAPVSPRDNYSGTAPYSAAIFIGTFGNTGTNAPEYGRTYVVF